MIRDIGLVIAGAVGTIVVGYLAVMAWLYKALDRW